MAKRKLEKFEQIGQMPNVFQNFHWRDAQLINYQQQKINLKGNWNKDFFQNNNPIVLELACGYGEYTVAIAKSQAQTNVIGIDIKGNRLWKGAKELLEQQFNNAAFVRTTINLLPHFFAPNEVQQIWLTFPDPQNQSGSQNKRLTSSMFIDIYRQIMPKNGIIHLKTDSTLLYDFTLSIIEQKKCKIINQIFDLYQSELYKDNDLLQTTTRYEKLNLSKADTIKYLSFEIG